MDARKADEVAFAFIERINEHSLEGISNLMRPDFRFVDALGSEIRGANQMRKAWTSYFRWFPDYKIHQEEILPKGNLVACFGTARGTYCFEGELRKENAWEVPAAWKAVVRGARIAEWRVYADKEPARQIMAAHKREPREPNS